jgi:hypothetical protein
MCFSESNVQQLERWNWDGDIIVHQSIVPSAREIVGVKPRTTYEIDVREFLVTERNEIMRRALQEDMLSYMKKNHGNPGLFASRKTGAFDYRAAVITNFVADKIEYRATTGRDPWLFPNETLKLGHGDCEDRAFLLASLLISSGISSFNIRVAFGQMQVDQSLHDHMWVMYKNERGKWMVIEPLQLGQALPDEHLPIAGIIEKKPCVQYIPYFLFNDHHLWAVRDNATLDSMQKFLKRKWQKLNPKFAGAVHREIIEEALGVIEGTKNVIKQMKKNFRRLFLFGPVIDSIDLDFLHYDPRDHFDNGYIQEGWNLVQTHLSEFKMDNVKNLQSFARAAHGIADFYAHSSYVHFAKLNNPTQMDGHAVLYNIDNPSENFGNFPEYQTPLFNINDPKFTLNTKLWAGTRSAAAELWKNKIISGRYAQKGDSQGDAISHVLESITIFPKKLMKEDANFHFRGALPHHNEIAVDNDKKPSNHQLYSDDYSNLNDSHCFANQFRWRRNSAVLHIREAFRKNWNGI